MPIAFHQFAFLSAAALLAVATCASHSQSGRRLCLKAHGDCKQTDAAGSASVEVHNGPKSALDSQEQQRLMGRATTSDKRSRFPAGKPSSSNEDLRVHHPDFRPAKTRTITRYDHFSAESHRRVNAHMANHSDNSTVRIQVYYESRCPYCASFLNVTLGSLWQKPDIKSNMQISLYPHGNAQTVPVSNLSMGYKFWHPKVDRSTVTSMSICQHGKDECFGNLIHACAIHLEPHEVHIDFVLCMSGRVEDSIEKASYECMEKVGMNSAKMKDCVMGEQGSNATNEMARQTEAVPGRVGTPWILVDGQNLEEPDDLWKVVCDILDYRPRSCTKFMGDEDNFPVMFQNMLDVLPKNV